jgi:uncharacterized membrane protein (DUF2068 family)
VPVPDKLRRLEHRSQVGILRTVATLELGKGVVVVVAAFGVILLMQHDPWDVANDLLQILHISPDHHFAQVFLDWADSLTDQKLWAIVGVALAYATLRFAEGYGLWHARPWAEWVALVSGAMYIPFELYASLRRPDPFHIAVLLGNLAIVLYMAYLRYSAHRAPAEKRRMALSGFRDEYRS